MMLIILVCALLGVVCAIIVNLLYNNGVLIDEIIEASETISITDLTFIVFFAWTFVGVVIGVFKS